MIKNIAHIAITVEDMNKSIDFYCRVLGFKKAFEIADPNTGSPWIVYVSIGNGQFVELFYNGETPNPWDIKQRGFSHLCFEVEDIHQIAKQIEDSGYILDKQPKFGVDNNWQCWTRDPDGVRIEMMQLGDDSPQKRSI